MVEKIVKEAVGLKFKLIISTDEEEEIRTYVQAPGMLAALGQISRELRSLYKGSVPDKIKTPEDAIDHIQGIFWDAVGECQIDL